MEYRGLLLLCAMLCGVCTAATGNEERSGKNVLGLFNVISFENSACNGNNNLNGTCYTADECSKLGGSSAGTCASGFGVCCTFSLGCGATSMENNTYAIMNSYSTSNDPSPCTYTICRNSPEVKKIRIDLTTFSIGGPAKGEAPYNNPGDTNADLTIGDCYGDRFTVTSPGAIVPPVICGLNTGQHMYVDSSDMCTTLSFNIDTLDIATTRKWYLEVSQLTSANDDTFHSCLQYHRGLSGVFASYNYDTSITVNAEYSATAGGPNYHLSEQRYDICWRREEGYCAICFSPVGLGTTAGAGTYGVSASENAAAAKSLVDATCTGKGGTVQGDYIEIQNLQANTLTGTAATRICGPIFNFANAQAPHVTACTSHLPFKWTINFDGGEVTSNNSPSPADMMATGENFAYKAPAAGVGGGGSIGFYMNYWQVSC